MKDYEKLALKFSLQSVEQAIEELRIDPAQEFFPTPSDVAALIDSKKAHNRYDSDTREWQAKRREWDKEKPVIEAHRKAWLESGLTLAEFNGKLEGNEP